MVVNKQVQTTTTIKTLLFSPEFRSIEFRITDIMIKAMFVECDANLLILLKRKGDKSIQEYETDAGIQKWTEQRLTKSSAQI
ncbi:hypothetical protein P5673_011701 [Acropora cervicornis]|uniref:Uncharacterized protein n=1 Tax=Acropora cervicornis TaxID=6130 RepID=A0AAD9QP94_ACRCE|nr:hypothetical protein P5673_011701 [Acropora cervicornis]